MEQRYSKRIFILEILAITLGLIFLIPFYFIIINSFKTFPEILLNTAAWPKEFQWNNYVEAWRRLQYPKVFLNSLLITVFSNLVIVVFCSMAAYRLVRSPNKVSKIIFVLFIAAMVIPFQSIMIPLVQVTSRLGLLNSIPGIVIMYLGFGAGFSVFLYHGFIKAIPREIEEAAIVDGCSAFCVFWRIGLAIYSGNEKHLIDTLNELFMTLKINEHISLEQLEIWEKEYQILKNHWLDEIDIKSDDIRDERIIFWDERGGISVEKFEEEKRRQFTILFSVYHKEKIKKDKNIIYEIKQFLEDNYQQDIKLHHISERFYFSREYISRKFKQEYNENITDYMVNIRMNKAKELLTYSNLPIREISNLVGYQDEKYFSKVFKKYEGFTPNDYRKSTINYKSK